MKLTFLHSTTVLKTWAYVRTHFFTCCVVAGFVWLVFFDQHSVLAIRRINEQASDMKKQKEEFEEMVETYRANIEEVSGDATQMEHFAREKLHMKKANEDVFIIED